VINNLIQYMFWNMETRTTQHHIPGIDLFPLIVYSFIAPNSNEKNGGRTNMIRIVWFIPFVK